MFIKQNSGQWQLKSSFFVLKYCYSVPCAQPSPIALAIPDNVSTDITLPFVVNHCPETVSLKPET